MSQNHSYVYDVTDHSLLDELFRACDGGIMPVIKTHRQCGLAVSRYARNGLRFFHVYAHRLFHEDINAILQKPHHDFSRNIMGNRYKC